MTNRYAIKGKNLVVDGQIFFVKGVTYGTFAPDEQGFQFPAQEIVETDFWWMKQSGINTVRTYTVPPGYVFEAAEKHNLKLMVGLPWEQHIDYLKTKKSRDQIVARLKAEVAACRGYDSILCFAIGNEIPAKIVRWHGKRNTENWLKRLYTAVKEVNPQALVTYVNYPTTEYLDLTFLDFECFNVYLEDKRKLEIYLSKLHNLAGNRPLVLAEIGLDSMRNGEDAQAKTLKWQVETVFEKGCAGAFVFAWTDEWWRGGHDIMDWDFGLVDRDRNPKKALRAVKSAFANAPFYLKEYPMISVVACSYNGSKTIRDTLEGLVKLTYPNYEVIVIDDGSTDGLPDIVREYPVKLVSTKNQGLSNARNRGMLEARGEIVAYIDDDAYPDKYWLHYLATAFERSNYGGIGGPNIAPADDGPIADCVANAPGGPIHVLESDEVAEHIPGCNMAFRKEALLKIGGCDPIFRAAGDDVDLCWRIQEAGYQIGFHPSAVVWHHRRNSVKTYWKQQQGYGKAEALLAKKWPEKYNGLGHVSWTGRIYGAGVTLPLQVKRKRIFFGVWGTAPFQSVYSVSPRMRSYIPLMPEWYFIAALLGGIALLGFNWPFLHWFWLPFALTQAIVIIQSIISAKQAVYSRNPKGRRKLKYLALTSFLHIIQPFSRLYGRLKHGINPLRLHPISSEEMKGLLRFGRTKMHWSETWKSLDEWIRIMEWNMVSHHCKVKSGSEFDRWDLQISTGIFAYVRVLFTVEDHAEGKQYLKMHKTLSPSGTGILLIVGLVALASAALGAKAFLAAIGLSFMAAFFVVKYLNDIVGANKELRIAFAKLPTGIEEAEEDTDASNSKNRKAELKENEEAEINWLNDEDQQVLVLRNNTLPVLYTYNTYARGGRLNL
jgi:GT2 family glycosyltransferase